MTKISKFKMIILARRYKNGEITEEEYDVGVDNIDAKYQGMTPTAGQKEDKEKVANFEYFKEQIGEREVSHKANLPLSSYYLLVT